MVLLFFFCSLYFGLFFLDTAGKSRRINDTIYQIIPGDQPPTKPGQHHMHTSVAVGIKCDTLKLN